MSWSILQGDCLEVLRTLESESVQTCVTSPPYWGLRDYGTAEWEGGDSECDHAPTDDEVKRAVMGASGLGASHTAQEEAARSRMMPKGDCPRCGAKRIDSQLGLEPTPEEYVENLVAVFREVRRVLRDDGTVWLNLGDSYASSGTTDASANERLHAWNADGAAARGGSQRRRLEGNRDVVKGRAPTAPGLKPKDLVGIPWRVAFALQADGWVLRSDVVWSKPNPMPESVTDRPTRSHEYIFMFAKAKWTGAEEPLPMKREDAIWLAALVDGEGSICFQENTSARAGQSTYSVRLSINNTNRALLDRVVEICGLAGVGVPQARRRRDGAPGRPVFAWQVTNAKAAQVIGAIRPYLIAKPRQADLALYVQALNRKHTGRGGHTVSRADQEAKARAAAACSELNRTGEADLSWFTSVKPGRWVPQPYFWDADAIREEATVGNHLRTVFDNGPQEVPPGTSQHNGIRHVGGAEAGRNKRSVWTVTTQPFSWRQNARRVRVERDEVSDDTMRSTSPSCPVHGGRSAPVPTAGDDGRGADDLSRSERSDDRHDQAPLDGLVPTDPHLEPDSGDGSSDSPRPADSPTATPHSNRSHKRASQTASSGTASEEMSARIEGTSRSNGSPGPNGSDSPDSSRTPDRTAHKPTCTCEYYRLEETDHFATFPPKLIEPCILAGSPPKCCGECGAPWERVVEIERIPTNTPGKGGRQNIEAQGAQPRVSDVSCFRTGLVPRTHTLGWRSTCEHDDDSGSATVLDPFVGSGTTGVVALRHDRSFIGIELNHEYAEMARNRIRDDAPLLNVGIEA